MARGVFFGDPLLNAPATVSTGLPLTKPGSPAECLKVWRDRCLRIFSSIHHFVQWIFNDALGAGRF
jgi:hypothetical protein